MPTLPAIHRLFGRGVPRVWDFPLGPAEMPCPDFAEVIEQWEPLGGAYYDLECVGAGMVHYDCENPKCGWKEDLIT